VDEADVGRLKQPRSETLPGHDRQREYSHRTPGECPKSTERRATLQTAESLIATASQAATVAGGGWRTVYVPGKEAKAHAVRLKGGISDGTYTEVEQGNLQPGDPVILGVKPNGPATANPAPSITRRFYAVAGMSRLIEVKDVIKIYTTGTVTLQALSGITLSIERGSFVAMMGPSGSGKSTFLNVLGCLDQPTSGSYRLDGLEVATLGRNQLAAIRNNKIGFVFQNFNLLPRTTALEDVELPLLYQRPGVPNRRERALAALEMVGLAQHAAHHPNQLSGGQQQRVAIARSLINQPELILADEPNGALDSRTSLEIMSIFQQLNHGSGITILLVRHEPDIAAHADRIIRFRDGRVMGDRPIENPREAAQELRAMPLVEDAADEEKEAVPQWLPYFPACRLHIAPCSRTRCVQRSLCWASSSVSRR